MARILVRTQVPLSRVDILLIIRNTLDYVYNNQYFNRSYRSPAGDGAALVHGAQQGAQVQSAILS